MCFQQIEFSTEVINLFQQFSVTILFYKRIGKLFLMTLRSNSEIHTFQINYNPKSDHETKSNRNSIIKIISKQNSFELTLFEKIKIDTFQHSLIQDISQPQNAIENTFALDQESLHILNVYLQSLNLNFLVLHFTCCVLLGFDKFISSIHHHHK